MNELKHYGIQGQKWGIRRFQNLDGTYTSAGKERYYTSKKVFVSGSSKTQDETSAYYRKNLPGPISSKLDSYMKDRKTILVGDAPGIDRQVQDYLKEHNYNRVTVYGPGKEAPRYLANSKWKTKLVDAPDYEPGSKEWLAAKDVKMTEDADEGLAVILDEGAKATRKNVERLLKSGKNAEVFQLDMDGPEKDIWVNGKVVAGMILEALENKGA